MIGYELFLRERNSSTEVWQLPSDFSQFSASEIVELLEATINGLPEGLKLISFNLDQKQFIDPEYLLLLPQLQRRVDVSIVVELTERSGDGAIEYSEDDVVNAARQLNDHHIKVCIDDVGTGMNQPDLLTRLDPYTTEYKVALQNLRGNTDYQDIVRATTYWANRAHALNLQLAIEGFEEAADVEFIARLHPDIVQGFYYGKPRALPILADFEERAS